MLSTDDCKPLIDVANPSAELNNGSSFSDLTCKSSARMFVFCNKILVSAIIGSKLPSTFLTVSLRSLARFSASSAMFVTSSTHSVATVSDFLTVPSVIAALMHRIKTPTPAKKIPA